MPPRRRPASPPWLLAVVTALVALLARDAAALTPPIAGAVALPPGAPLELPFPAGTDVFVLSGYGPSGGSSLHADTDAANKANDHYALDLTYANEPNGGKGLPIVAALAGTVVKAGWATQGWANYGQRVILEHDLGDGHVYHSLYAHLDSITVAEGSQIAQGAQLGTLGQSCQGALSCGSFSAPHLHWALHRDSLIGGSGTGGSYGGNAVVPEPISGHEDLAQGQTLTSSNTGTPSCGDGFCSPGEDGASCPADCCGPIPPAGRVVDDLDPCFDPGGSPQYLYSTPEGYAGGALWTHATDAAAVDNSGTWALAFDEAGEYAVSAYVEPGFAGATAARYVVEHAGATDEVVVDQSTSPGWIELGSFAFAAGGQQRVFLGDVTGEPFSQMKPIVFDAVELVRIGGGGSGGAGGAGGAGGGGSAGSGAGGSDGGSGGGIGGQGGGAGGAPQPGGCGCAAGTRAGSGLAAALGLLALVLRRRGARRPAHDGGHPARARATRSPCPPCARGSVR